MSEDNNKHNESSAPKFLAETQEMTTSNDDMSSPKVLVVGRNKTVTDEEFDMRDKTRDHEAAEVWSILTLLLADEKKYSGNGK
jgi:hypothetical protein